jgi:hypothetical protein
LKGKLSDLQQAQARLGYLASFLEINSNPVDHFYAPEELYN